MLLAVVAVLAVLLVPVMVATAALPSPPQRAAAPAPGAAVPAPLQRTESLPVLVELDAVDPAVLGPGVPFVIRGTLRNLSLSPVPVREVRAVTTYRSLDTRAAVQAWSTGNAGVTPSRVLGVDLLGGADMAPGASRSFFIRVDGESLNPPFGFATLPLALEVVAADNTVRGRLRSYLPWYAAAAPADQPLNLSWVVPLTVPAQPELAAADPEVRDAAWLRAIGAQSPARVWLEGLSDQRATFVVDPALLTPLPPVGEVTDPVPAPLPTPTATGSPTPTSTQPAVPEPTPEATSEPAPEATSERGPDPTTTADNTASSPAPETPSEGSVATGAPAPSDTVPSDTAPPTLPGVDLPEVLTPVQQAQVDLQTRLAGLGRDRVWWLPAGDPDLAALLDLQAAPSVLEQLVPGVSPQSPLVAGQLVKVGRHDVAWPTWSRVNEDDLTALAQAWPAQEQPLAGVMVPDTSVQARDATGTTGGALRVPAGPAQGGDAGTLTLLAYDTTLSGLVASAPRPQRDGAVIQRLVAETLAIYQQAPAQARTLIIAPPRQAGVDPRTLSDLTTALGRAPWLAQTDTTETMAAPAAASLTGTPLPQAAPGDRTAYPMPRRSPLSAGRLSEIETLRSMLQEISVILPSDQAVQRWQPVLDGLYSTRWRARPDSWSTPLTELTRQVEQVQGGVRVNPTTVNFLTDEGLIQMTVVNTLPTDVQDLVLHLEPGNGRLRIIEAPEPIAIGARSRATVQFRAQAVAAGEVPVRAYLTTPSGLEIGAQEELTVQVRPTGEWIYWVLGGVAGVILILGLARAVRRPGAASTPGPEVLP